MYHQEKELCSDLQLIELLKNDDAVAFELLYKRYYAKLFSSAARFVQDRDICKDIVQEVFIQLWSKRHSAEIKQPGPYLHAITRFQVFRVIKRGANSQEISEAIHHLQAADSSETKTNQNDILRLLETETQGLPGRCQVIFRMSRNDSLSVKQIAEELGISPKTVENQITIALKRLRTAFGDFF